MHEQHPAGCPCDACRIRRAGAPVARIALQQALKDAQGQAGIISHAPSYEVRRVDGKPGKAPLVDQDPFDGTETYQVADAVRADCEKCPGDAWRFHDVYTELAPAPGGELKVRLFMTCRDCGHETRRSEASGQVFSAEKAGVVRTPEGHRKEAERRRARSKQARASRRRNR